MAQRPRATPTDSAESAPVGGPGCEYRTGILYNVGQNTPAGELILVIARLGDGETSSALSWRRLINVRTFWTVFLTKGYGRRSPEGIILAEGERVKGPGRLEFYVGGKRADVMLLAPNADATLDACYPPDDYDLSSGVYDRCLVKGQEIFYPCRDRSQRRRRGR